MTRTQRSGLTAEIAETAEKYGRKTTKMGVFVVF